MYVIVHSKTGCPYCDLAKQWLTKHGFDYEEVQHNDPAERKRFYESCGEGVRTVPQIFVDGKRIGGYSELIKSGIEHKKNLDFDADF